MIYRRAVLSMPPGSGSRARLLGWLVASSVAGCLAADSPIHLLLPGFVAEEIPVHLPNANNLRFAPDGSLTVLGYDGRVWRVTDTNGDGLEDTAALWWDRPTMTVPVGMCWSTSGLIVSSQGKVSLLRDSDGGGRADQEQILAQGWPDKDTASGNVDATGVTVGPDGAIYFALLTANYANPYRLKPVAKLTSAERAEWLRLHPGETVLPPEDQEVSLYDPRGERGSVQRLDPVTGRRETFATGLRVVYQLAFNQDGDLFCTDQEGETWCPKGNPLDELNHVVRGQHYGFPPRHPRWLPQMDSRAPVVDFGPQHQSSCGLAFNEPVTVASQATSAPNPSAAVPVRAVVAQGLFGPESWRGNAFIAGESRGKIWRVALEKYGAEYHGSAQILARLPFLATDVAISPRGDLYVSCHSGLPDWGTGPTGAGHIFRIRQVDRTAPLPVRIAMKESGRSLEISWDRPLDVAVTRKENAIAVESGLHVRAGDRWETLKPPYEAVKRQEAEPRENQVIADRTLSGDGRTLTLHLAKPGRTDWSYSATLAGIRNADGTSPTYVVDLDLPGPEPTHMAENAATSPSAKPEAAGQFVGDFETGRAVFTRLQCATCHRLRGEGAGEGPDLDNLAGRDREGILLDIRDPNVRINPDYVGYNVTLQDGDTLTGFLRTRGNDTLRLVAATGAETLLKPADVRELQPSGQSLMPAGLLDGLKNDEVEGLLTFLRTAPPTGKDATNATPVIPKVLTRPPNPARLVLVASKQDHGPGQHDYPRWQTNWLGWLVGGGLVVQPAWEWPSPAQWEQANVVVFYCWNHDWSAGRLSALDAFQRRGGGVVLLHSACISDTDPEALVPRFGLAANPTRTGYRHMPFRLQLKPGHAITQGSTDPLDLLDEPYWPLIGDPAAVTVLATAEVDGAARPLVWAFERPGGGRTFSSIPGHYTWTLDDPRFRELILRGIAWAAGR